MAGHPGDVRDERREDPASAAVTDLFRCHHLELVRLALLMTGDLAAAEDVVQDAFEQLHRRWPSLRQPGSSLAIEALKAAFMHGRLTKAELDTRAGQALSARTYADLAALTTDIPPASAAARPERPLAPARAGRPHPGRRTAGTGRRVTGHPRRSASFDLRVSLWRSACCRWFTPLTTIKGRAQADG